MSLANRWNSDVFSMCVALREQSNCPEQLTLIRRGVYKAKPLLASLEALHSKNEETLGSFSERLFRSEVLTPLESIDREGLHECEVQSIRAYTLQFPKYFEVLNSLLYDSQNAAAQRDLDVWLDFLSHLESGMEKLRRRRGGAPVLYRLMWLPANHLDEYYVEGREIVFKGFSSASDSILEDFYFEALNDPERIRGKVCILLEFDAACRRKAEGIRSWSKYPAENEHLFAPYLRVKVGVREPLEQFPTRRADAHFPVLRIQLHGTEALAPVPQLLDWNHEASVSINKLLEIALVFAIHSGSPNISNTLLGIEGALREQVCALPDFITACTFEVDSLSGAAWRAAWTTAAMAAAIVSVSVGPLSALVLLWHTGRVHTMLAQAARAKVQFRHACGYRQYAESASMQEALEASHCKEQYLQRTLQSIREDIMEDLTLESLLWQFERHLVRCRELHEHISRQPAGETDELRQLVCRLVTMLIEAGFVEQVVVGAREVKQTMDMSYPYPLSMKDDLDHERWSAIRENLQGWGQNGMLHPVLADLEVGNQIHEEPGPSGLQSPKSVLARLDHLRVFLSHLRLLLPLGLPDSGKSTVLNAAFGFRFPAGRTAELRTQTLQICECADYPWLRVVDAPGYGDAVAARNDAVRLAESLAEGCAGLMFAIVVLVSGRDVQSTLDAEVQAFKQMGVRFVVVLTQADVRFEQLSCDRLNEENPAEGSPEEAQLFRRVADEIKEEDRRRVERLVGDDPVTTLYTCLAGKFVERRRGEAVEPEVKQAFFDHMQPCTGAGIKEAILREL